MLHFYSSCYSVFIDINFSKKIQANASIIKLTRQTKQSSDDAIQHKKFITHARRTHNLTHVADTESWHP